MLIRHANSQNQQTGTKRKKQGVKGLGGEKRARVETAPARAQLRGQSAQAATVAQTEARNANSILARTFFSLDCSTNTLAKLLRTTYGKTMTML